ncbi:MAG: 30S ribosomal protein S17 [Thermoleophilaceae bacterium]
MIEEPENPTPEEETPAEAPEEAAPEAPAEEPAAEEPVAEAEAATPSSQPPTPETSAEPAEPAERLSPKERRKRSRSQAGEQRPTRTLEERLAEREQARQRLAQHRRTRRARERDQRRATSGERTPQQAEPASQSTGRARVRQGVVVSDKADKTITVQIEIARPHRVYKKIVRTSSTLHAHDERNEAHVGDTVRLIESRPLSRTKRWRLVEVLERAR